MPNIDGSRSLAHIEIDTQGGISGGGEEQFRFTRRRPSRIARCRPLAGIPEIVLTAKLV
jgi:hypothetical protein